jgi:hypothetical protein
MATALEPIGEAEIGQSFSTNFQVSAGGLNNRIVTRRYKMRVADHDAYTLALINPTTYDATYASAIIIDQGVAKIPDDRVNCVLTRIFAEVPTMWDEPQDRVITFPGVARSSLYALNEFAFRSAQTSYRTDVRINRRYFLGDPKGIPRFTRFKVFDAYGLETTVISDFTTPTVDEYISMVAGSQEIVIDSKVVPWRGWIQCLETTYAKAK